MVRPPGKRVRWLGARQRPRPGALTGPPKIARALPGPGRRPRERRRARTWTIVRPKLFSGAGARSRLEPELLAHDARDLAAVGAPARLAHDVADDDPDRLHVAGAQPLDDVRVGVERGLDDRRRACRRRRSPPGPRPRRSRRGRRPRPTSRSRTCLAAPWVTFLSLDQPDERGERAGLHLRLRRVLDVDARDELVDPVGQRLGLGAVARRGRPRSSRRARRARPAAARCRSSGRGRARSARRARRAARAAPRGRARASPRVIAIGTRSGSGK